MQNYEIGNLVTILSTRWSGGVQRMDDMIGKVFAIEGIPDSKTCIINDWYWSTRDIKKFKAEKKEIKAEIFDINNLI
jgi:hypothetical protein